MTRPPIRGNGYKLKGGAGPTREQNARLLDPKVLPAYVAPASVEGVVRTRVSAGVPRPMVVVAALVGVAFGAAGEFVLVVVSR